MRAAMLRNKRMEVGDIPVPEPGPGEVLVKTLACGICGSDLHVFHRAQQEPNGGGGIVMGHEFVGEIVDYGPETRRHLKPGTRVNSIPILGRKSGAEFIGYSDINPGGYAEFMRLTEDHLLEIPNGLSTEHAALTEPMAVGWHAVNKARLRPGDVPLVIGCGAIGLAVIAGLKIKGAHPIVAASRSARRRELALAMGADLVVDPTERSPYEAWREQAQTGLPDPGPTLPGWPPSTPNGATTRWLASITAVIGARKRTRRSPPSPPRLRPAPPVPRRIRNASTRTGKRHSRTSGSVSRELVMCVCTTLAPSKPGPAPAPPAIVS